LWKRERERERERGDNERVRNWIRERRESEREGRRDIY